MKLQIERPYFEAMVTSFPGLASLREQLRFGDKLEVAFGQLSDAELGYLTELYSRTPLFRMARSVWAPVLRRRTGFFTEDPNSTHRDTDWSRKEVPLSET
jgi:hypothetical protein